MQTQLESGCTDIAKELDTMVAPVAIAWRYAIGQDRQVGLWQADGLHPSREGTYLAGCIVNAAIFLQSPVGLKYGAGQSQETAQFLQAVAAETVSESSEGWSTP